MRPRWIAGEGFRGRRGIIGTEGMPSMVDLEVAPVPRQDGSSAAAAAEVPSDVREFCEREGCTEELQTALEMGPRYFGPEPPEFSIVRDPDAADDEWVSIHIPVPQWSEDLWQHYRRFEWEWVGATRWPQRHKVRLSYTFR